MKNPYNNDGQDSKCIWVSAGVVNYKLCDRNYECERCEFHRAMCGLLPGQANAVEMPAPTIDDFAKVDETFHTTNPAYRLINQYLNTLFSGCTIHLDHCYHPTHFWCKPENDNSILVGVDPLVMRMLDPVERLILPETGKFYRSRQLISCIVRKGQTISLHAPFEGLVTKLNSKIAKNDILPLISNNVYLFKLKGKNLRRQVEVQCGNMNGLECYTQKLATLRKSLFEAGREHPAELGTTMADGGKVEMDLEKIIGEERFRQLVFDLFQNS
ncbi:MAG: hypothetical protein V3U73_05030 [bacterium]